MKLCILHPNRVYSEIILKIVIKKSFIVQACKSYYCHGWNFPLEASAWRASCQGQREKNGKQNQWLWCHFSNWISFNLDLKLHISDNYIMFYHCLSWTNTHRVGAMTLSKSTLSIVTLSLTLEYVIVSITTFSLKHHCAECFIFSVASLVSLCWMPLYWMSSCRMTWAIL